MDAVRLPGQYVINITGVKNSHIIYHSMMKEFNDRKFKSDNIDHDLDDLAFDMGSKINIEKNEWDKLINTRNLVFDFLINGRCDCDVYCQAMELTDSYLRLIPLDEFDADEVYIKKRLLASKKANIGVAKALEETLKAYDRIISLIENT